MNPDSWTLRELVWARDGRQKSDWWHSATLQALIANVNRPPHKPAFSPYDFHPLEEKPKKRSLSVEELERLLLGKG